MELRVAEIHVIEIRAKLEGLQADRSQRRWEGYGGQMIAGGERPLTDAYDALGDLNNDELTAPAAGVIPYLRDIQKEDDVPNFQFALFC